ncbi:unnamed protein product, partial [Closterium sp. NIES-54]
SVCFDSLLSAPITPHTTVNLCPHRITSNTTRAHGQLVPFRLIPTPTTWHWLAVCLDGSAPGFYYRRGHGSGANKWLLNFRSGAWCTTPWDCYNRSSSLWGSSNHFPDVLPTPGILSAQSDVNPDLYDWNLVIFPYCDGASFSGDRHEPLVFEVSCC